MRTQIKWGWSGGAFIEPFSFSGSHRELLAELLDETAIRRLERVVAVGLAEKRFERERPKNAEQMEALRKVQQHIAALVCVLDDLDTESRAAVRRAQRTHGSDCDTMRRVSDELRLLDGQIELTWRDLKAQTRSGAPKAIARRAIAGLTVDVLVEAGVPVTAYDAGPAATVLTIVFAACGIHLEEPRKYIADALSSRAMQCPR